MGADDSGELGAAPLHEGGVCSPDPAVHGDVWRVAEERGGK